MRDSQHSSTKQCGHRGELRRQSFRPHGTVSPKRLRQVDHPRDLPKLVISIPHVWPASESISPSSDSCDTKAYASASSPTPVPHRKKQSAAPNGELRLLCASPPTTASAEALHGIYRDVLPPRNSVENTSPLHRRPSRKYSAPLRTSGVKGIAWTGPEQARRASRNSAPVLSAPQELSPQLARHSGTRFQFQAPQGALSRSEARFSHFVA